MTSRTMDARTTAALFLLLAAPAGAQVAVTVDGGQQYQVIDGYGVSANSLSWNGGELRPALDLLVDQLGATLWRVVIDNMDWEATNDNADPNAFNWAYYNTVYSSAKFQELWGTLGYLNQKGIRSGLMLNFMGPAPAWMGGSTVGAAFENEFVEMIASLVWYARNTAGIDFTLLSPLNEPNWDGIEGPFVNQVSVMRKLAQKLDAIGLSSIRFIAPERAGGVGGFQSVFDEFVQDPVVMAKMAHWALHDYGGNVAGAESMIQSSPYPNMKFWVTEVTNIWDIIGQIPQGPSANLVWDGYDSVYNHAILAGRGTTPPNDAGNGPALLAYNATTGVYTPRKAFYECAQLFKFVTPQSVRIGASANNANLQVFAFRHPATGRVTIFGRNTGGGTLSINGTLTNLAGVSTLEFYRTNSSLNLQRGADVPVSAGQFAVQVPGNTLFTLTGLAGGSPGNQPPAVSITAPSSGAAFTAPATITIGAAASDPDGTVARVEFFQGATSLGQDAGAPYSFTWNGVPAGSYTLTARATDNLGATATSAPVTVTVNPGGGGTLPSPWQSADVGTVGQAGSASFSAGAFTAQGSGDDIWNAADAFRFVYQALPGDGEIVARVAGLQNTNPWAKAGVMIRETLAAGSAHAATFVTPSNGVAFQRRVASGGASTGTAGPAVAAPTWLRLARAGSTFTGYSSSDGVSWTPVGSDTIAMGASVFVGLAVTAHDNALLAAATFDNVSVTSSADTDGDGMSDAFETGFGFNPANPDQDANGTLDGLDDWDADTIPNASDPSPGSPPGTGAGGGGGGGGGGGCGAIGLDAILLLVLLAGARGRLQRASTL